MTHKHGYFVGAVGSEAEHFAHLDIVKPPILTYLDNPAMAVKAKKRYPDCAVIWRQNRQYRDHGGTTSNSDADLHTVYPNTAANPHGGSDKFLDERERIMNAHGWERNVFIKLHNETGWNKASLDWQHVTTERALKRGIPVAPGGWSVGAPEFHQIPEALPTLQLASDTPFMVLYILNEYFAAIWMSGFTHDGITQPGDSLYFTRFIPRDQWPKTMDKVTAFHCGRVHQWIRFCESKGLQVRFGIGEHGPDAVGGDDEGGKKIDAWRKGLIRTGSREPRFYQGLEAQYRAWWNMSAGEALAHQLVEGSNNVTYNHPDIVGYCYFTEGQSSADWEFANTERDRDFKRVIEAAASRQEQVSMPIPKPAKASKAEQVRLIRAAQGFVNLRSGPGDYFTDKGDIKIGDTFTLFREPKVFGRPYWWYWVEDTRAGSGWLAEFDQGMFEPVVTNGTKPPAPQPSEKALQLLRERIAQAISGFQKSADEIKAEMDSLTRQRDAVKAKRKEVEAEYAAKLTAFDDEIEDLGDRISMWAHTRTRVLERATLIEMSFEDFLKEETTQ